MANLFQPSLSQITDDDGNPVSGGKRYFYLTETSTLATVYADQAGTTPLANPVVADSNGRTAAVYLDPDITYRYRITDAGDTPLRDDVDPVRGYDAGMVQDAAESAIAAAEAASGSENAAATSATSASGSASAASASATSASGSATAAASSATSAATSASDAADAVTDATAAIGVLNVYSNTTLAAAKTAGLAAVGEGVRFAATGDDVDYIGIYEDNSGVAVEKTRIAKNSAISGLSGDTTARTAANSETWRAGKEKRVALDHTTSVLDFWESLKAGETTAVFPQAGDNSRIHLCWEAGQLGIAESGTLTEVSIRTGALENRENSTLATTTGAKVQAWVVRPTATLPTAASSVTVNKVAAIGELALDDNQAQYRDNVTFTGLRIPVVAGDLIAIRVVGAGIRYAANSGGTGEYNNTWSLLITDTDTSLSAIATSKTATANGGAGTSNARRFFHKATVVKKDYQHADNSPRGPVKLDATARIPLPVSRAPDNPWHGKKVAFLGSSISTYGGGGPGTGEVGHIPMVAEWLQCDPYFLGVGSSYGTYSTGISGGSSSLFIGATSAEQIARFGNDAGSYETLIIGKSFDAVVMPDMINDSNLTGFSVGSLNDGDPSTIYGSLQRMIEAMLTDRPSMQIYLQTPAHRWASYAGSGAPVEQANRRLIRDAMVTIADHYCLPPVIDFIKHGGIGPKQVQNGNGLYDTIHPQIGANGPRSKMARYMYGVMTRHGGA